VVLCEEDGITEATGASAMRGANPAAPSDNRVGVGVKGSSGMAKTSKCEQLGVACRNDGDVEVRVLFTKSSGKLDISVGNRGRVTIFVGWKECSRGNGVDEREVIRAAEACWWRHDCIELQQVDRKSVCDLWLLDPT
jgi:hypothetical protein